MNDTINIDVFQGISDAICLLPPTKFALKDVFSTVKSYSMKPLKNFNLKEMPIYDHGYEDKIFLPSLYNPFKINMGDPKEKYVAFSYLCKTTNSIADQVLSSFYDS